ncbi:peptide deformylase, partial [Lacticaseibacillus paracasei]
MSILELVPSTDPILSEIMPKFDFDKPPINPEQLAVDLAETMIANKGLGLSANQVGLRHRALVITGSPIIAIFN